MTDIYDPYFANGVAAPFFEYALTSKWMDKEYLHLNRLVFFNLSGFNSPQLAA